MYVHNIQSSEMPKKIITIKNFKVYLTVKKKKS